MTRVLLDKDFQIKLCLAVKEKLGLSWVELARSLRVHPNTFANWYTYKRLLPQHIFNRLMEMTPTPIIIDRVEFLPDNWGQIKGGKRSSQLQGRVFGSIEWRKRVLAKVVNANKSRSIKSLLPVYSSDLAEFIGIMLGDGGIYRGQISVTLGYTTDKEYMPYIRKLIYRLFKAKTSIYRSKNRDFVRISAFGINLVNNLLTLGLVRGNKAKHPKFDVPSWIFKDKSYIRACLRGLIDTDGCVHRKVRKEKGGIEYRSIGITQSSYSVSLQSSIIKLFNILGFKVSISGTTIYLCGQKQIERYAKEIGFSNPKHLNRYKSFLNNYGWKKFISENCLIWPATV